ncbi:ABC transmembrane type-1 domain-containing protein [Hyphomicrobiales bacterium]|nr:ABC transmembrane type-1 domain-containing protein [Hyphomicrobiales bacterium]CAH1690034.1 ABC transmembrane type-1 domain-containing protein [Hyphomicrobiales bacterium]
MTTFLRADKTQRFLGLTLYALVVLVVMLPLSWAFFGSFKPQSEIFAYPPRLLPEAFSISAYAEILSRTEIPRFLLNSIIVTLATTILVLIVASIAAYGFSRWEFRYKNGIMVALLVCQLIPSGVIIIPYYVMMSEINLVNTHIGLILVFTSTHIPFALWIIKGQFDAIPTTLDEAAIIDGASRVRILWTVIIPVSLPGLGAAACLTFITVWAEFLVPMVLANSPETTLVSVGLYNLFGRDSTTFYNQLFAAATLATAPVIIAYLLAQEQFISGLTGGAEK